MLRPWAQAAAHRALLDGAAREIRDAHLEIDRWHLARDDPQMPLEMLTKSVELHRKGATVPAGGAEPDQREMDRLARPQQTMSRRETRVARAT
jgi:hypothetical protein